MWESGKILTQKAGEWGGTCQEKEVKRTWYHRSGDVLEKTSVSMGTLNMKIFKATIYCSSTTSFLFFFFLIPSAHPMVLLWLCRDLRWILIQVSPLSSRPKEQLGQDKNIIQRRRVSSVLNWCLPISSYLIKTHLKNKMQHKLPKANTNVNVFLVSSFVFFLYQKICVFCMAGQR